LTRVLFSPDGGKLASASSVSLKDGAMQLGRDEDMHNIPRPGDIKVWNLRTGDAGRMVLRSSVKEMAFTPDGKELVWVNWPNRVVKRWDLTPGREKEAPVQMPPEFMCAALSADGKHVVLARKDGTIRLWDLATNQQRFLFKVDPKQKLWFLVSRDGRTVFCADDFTHKALVWDVEAAKVRKAFPICRGSCTSMNIARDGKHVAVAGLDKELKPGLNIQVPVTMSVLDVE
jgi:WD40 repeat protein